MTPSHAHAMQRALTDGHPVLVRGELPMVLPIPPGWAALRVRCEPGGRPFAPLREAAARALQWIGEEHAIDSIGMMRVGDGVRPESLARAINRLAAKTPTGCALLFDTVNHADDDTLALLRRWLSMPGSLRMPVVLAFSDDALSGEAQALFATARELGAVEVVVTVALSRAAAVTAEEEANWGAVLRALGPDELMTLRAAAVLGSRFDIGDLAAVRELGMIKALELLQRARDLGAPLDDDGHDTLAMPDGLMRALRGTVLPSLARLWQQRATARRSSPVMAVSPAVPTRAHAAMPVPRMMMMEAAEGGAAPESAVRREAPQSRRRRVELDGTIGVATEFDEVAVDDDD